MRWTSKLLLGFAAIGVMLSPLVFADTPFGLPPAAQPPGASPQPAQPPPQSWTAIALDARLVGLWTRNTNPGHPQDRKDIDIASDGTVKCFQGDDPAPRLVGTMRIEGNQYHILFSSNIHEDGLFNVTQNSLTLTNALGAPTYSRAVAYMAAPPPDLPLMLGGDQRWLDQIVADRAAIAIRFHPELAQTVSQIDAPCAPAAGLARGAWNDRVAEALPALLQRCEKLCEAQRGAQAVPMLRQMLEHCPNLFAHDAPFMFVYAQAQSAAGDLVAARLAYDEVLLQRPDFMLGYLARGTCSAMMGSGARLDADLSIAGALDPQRAGAFLASHRRGYDELLAEANQNTSGSADNLANGMIASAIGGADVPQLLKSARLLRRQMNAVRRVPMERYQDGLRVLSAAIAAYPNDPQAWSDLADYIYRQSALKYGIGRSDAIEQTSDIVAAMRLDNEALLLDPHNLTAVATRGWLLRQDHQEKDAQSVAEQGQEMQRGYPRFAELQAVLLNDDAIRTHNVSEEQAVKSGRIFGAGWLESWSRGPGDNLVPAARQFELSSVADLPRQNRALYIAWRKFEDALAQMNVAARYYEFTGNAASAVQLWQRVLQFDSSDTAALFGLERIGKKNHQDALAFEAAFALQNIYGTTSAAPIDRAAAEIGAGKLPEAQADLNLAMRTDPANAAIYNLLGKIAAAQKGAVAWWPCARCGEALEAAAAELRGVNLAAQAQGPVWRDQVQGILAFWREELAAAQRDGLSDLVRHYQMLIDHMEHRIALADAGQAPIVEQLPPANPGGGSGGAFGKLPPKAGAALPPSGESGPQPQSFGGAPPAAAPGGAPAAAPAPASPMRDPYALSPPPPAANSAEVMQRATIEHLRILLADNEYKAAARCCLAAPDSSGAWHHEAAAVLVDLEFPIYLYLKPRLYHYQLWHYFGPKTLIAYETYARNHTAIDPANPPSRVLFSSSSAR